MQLAFFVSVTGVPNHASRSVENAVAVWTSPLQKRLPSGSSGAESRTVNCTVPARARKGIFHSFDMYCILRSVWQD